MLHFITIANKQGQLRLTRFYGNPRGDEEKISLATDITQRCLKRAEKQCMFIEHQDMTVVYRRYSSLYFMVGITPDENKLAILEFINNFVEILNKYFERVSELDIVFNQDRVHYILDEMVTNGCIGESSVTRVLMPLKLLDAGSR